MKEIDYDSFIIQATKKQYKGKLFWDLTATPNQSKIRTQYNLSRTNTQ